MTVANYRPLQPRESSDVLSNDEIALRDVINQSLNIPSKAWPTILANVGRENLRVLCRNDRVVAGCGIYPMGQWFGGKIVPSAGVTLVGVAPDCRGTGVAKELLTELLREAHQQGTPLASLYASSQRVYRSVGFEQAGHRLLYEFELQHIGNSEKRLEMHPVSLDDSQPFESLYEWHCRQTTGLLERSWGLWNRILRYNIDPEAPQYGYLIGDRDQPEGYVILRQESVENVIHKLVVRDHVVQTPAAAETLWSFLAGHRSVVPSVVWSGPSNDSLLCLPDESRYIKVADWHRWMLRVVDVRKALEARGYPRHVSAELHLEVTDDIIQENNGRFIVSIHEGTAHVEPGGNGALRLDIKGLAPLYSGMLTPAQLQRVGWIDGSEDALQQAEPVFRGPEPWLVEMF